MTTEIAEIKDPITEQVEASLALADLRAQALGVPVEVMQQALQEYADRRGAFRKWLREQLVEGVHFGTPPGCEPKVKEINGVKHYSQGGGQFYPEGQWTPKPSLYKAGADYLIDLMGVRDEYEADIGSWEQLGKPAGTFVRRCRLYSKANGALLGEGTGACKSGSKKFDDNGAIKMADKRAKVAAVLNTWGMADLFTQDLEDGPPLPPKHDNPNDDPNSPTAPGRGDRVTVSNLTYLLKEFKGAHPDATPKDWEAFVQKATGRVFPVRSSSEWYISDYKAVKRALGIAGPEDGPEPAKQTGELPF